jgi:hypothetical protein
MTPEEAKQIIDVLARGVDPETGELLPDDSPLNGSHVIRALFIAGKALELIVAARALDLTVSGPVRPDAATPEKAAKAGKPWSEDEDRRLLAGFDANTPVAVLARTHERTSGAITSRLIRLGRLQIRQQEAGEPNGGAAI